MDNWDLKQWLEQKRGERLFLLQRLDAGASGLLLMAKSEATALNWAEKLQKRAVHKTYLFISQGPPISNPRQTVTSTISKKRGHWVTEDSPTPNAETDFTWLASQGDFQLWQARPHTEKSQQIRLHAQSIGVPILGDTELGGRSFFRLCLHALQIEDPENSQSWMAPAPSYFSQLSLLANPMHCALIDAIHQRQQLQNQGCLVGDTYRISHGENPLFRIDRFGDQHWIYDYRPNPQEQEISNLLDQALPAPAWIREMKDRGLQPNSSNLFSYRQPLTRWHATENELKYELRADQGLSPGLFLDQRENRKWVKDHSRGKRVLNLFSYTCGFSLSAVGGGATEVVSVDVSASFLKWGKTNFELNDFDPANFEFYAADSMDFLNRTKKIGRKFDLIICDPPSFGRTARGIFKIAQHLPSMVELIFGLLAPGGQLLLCTNFEQWTAQEFAKHATSRLPLKSFKIGAAPLPGLDFIEPGEFILKTLLLVNS
jgi:23S rRNA (cytosine1962-C5)-methyltransferase